MCRGLEDMCAESRADISLMRFQADPGTNPALDLPILPCILIHCHTDLVYFVKVSADFKTGQLKLTQNVISKVCKWEMEK